MPDLPEPTTSSLSAADDRRRWITLYVLCTGMLMIVLDVTVVNVALPSIQDDLDFSQSNLAWVVNAYLVPFGGLLLLAGRLGDLLGRTRVFLTGLTVFVAASLLCGISQNQEMLVGARFLQGIGGALTSAVILGMIVTMFPKPAEQAKAIGAFTFVAVAGGTIGLLVGGVITEAISWHWIFLLNLPIGIVTGIMARRLLDSGDRGAGLAEGADVPGAVLITSALMLGVYTIVGVAEEGWTSTRTLGLGAISVLLVVLFVVRETHAAKPLVPFSIFRSRNVTGANIIQMLAMAGLFGIGFLGALYLQRVLGYTPVKVGLAFLPATLIMGVLSLRVTAGLIGRFGSRKVLIVGLVFVALSLVLFARVPVDGDYVTDVLPIMLLQGIGPGLAFPALMTLAMSGATPENAGVTSGIVNTTQQIGGAIGLSVLATLSTTRSEHLQESGSSLPEALTGGYHLAFIVGAGLVVAALIIAITVLRQPPATPEPDEPFAHYEPELAEIV